MFRKREKLLYDTSVSAGKIGTSEPHMHTCREAGWDVQCILNCADTVEAVEDAQRPFVKYNLKLSKNLLSF